jgi:hypothetical protein
MTTPHLVNDHNRLIDEAKLRAAELRKQAAREFDLRWLLVPVVVALIPIFAVVITTLPASDTVLAKAAPPVVQTTVVSGK